MVENYNKLAAISTVPAPPVPPSLWQSANAPSTRRRFVLGILGTAVLAASASVLVWHNVKGVFVTQPTAADLELAELGERFRKSSPEMAQQLEAFARQAAGLAPAARIDWEAALASRALLTEHSRVQAEFGRGDTVYFSGWLLGHSEIGMALLFAVANANSNATQDTTLDIQSPVPRTE